MGGRGGGRNDGSSSRRWDPCLTRDAQRWRWQEKVEQAIERFSTDMDQSELSGVVSICHIWHVLIGGERETTHTHGRTCECVYKHVCTLKLPNECVSIYIYISSPMYKHNVTHGRFKNRV